MNENDSLFTKSDATQMNTLRTSDPAQPLQQYRAEALDPTSTTSSLITFSKGLQAIQPLILNELPLPNSGAFQENSFSRRLLRVALENAYRLLTNPNSRPEDVSRVCARSVCHNTKPRMIRHVQDLMRRTAKDNFEQWNVPQWHTGGAGLHYPRLGLDAGTINGPPSTWKDRGPIGPFPPAQPHTPVPDEFLPSQVLECFDFDGEWFDTNDVDQYLRTKGVYLDGQSSIAEIIEPDEALVPDLGAQGLSVSSPAGSSSSSTSFTFDANLQSDTVLQNDDYSWNGVPIFNMPAIQDPGMDFSFSSPGLHDNNKAFDSSTFDASLGLNMLPDFMPTFNPKMRKIVDVEKFLSGM